MQTFFYTNMDNFYNPRPSGQQQPICFVHAKSEGSTQFKMQLAHTFLMRESDTMILLYVSFRNHIQMYFLFTRARLFTAGLLKNFLSILTTTSRRIIQLIIKSFTEAYCEGNTCLVSYAGWFQNLVKKSHKQGTRKYLCQVHWQ